MGKRLLPRLLLASTALTCATIVSPHDGNAAPQDGVVTGGSAVISQSGLNTDVTQSSDRAIIDWRSFDLGANEAVHFYQPGSSSLTVNRINDTRASQIDGNITANGQVMLLNQNGIIFGAGSRVDVAGLVASTGRIDDAAFMGGATTLQVTPGDNHNAAIINHGTISARDAGLVGLVAPVVENHGVIKAHLGKVTLAGAERVTLDLAGDNLIAVDVSDQIDGKVVNTGSITADGGTITLTASRAHDTVEASIVNTGTLRANTVSNRNGRIILSAGGNRNNSATRGRSSVAAVRNAGTIIAKGTQNGSTGGKVELLGDSVQLTSSSLIDVSGSSGGGTVNIGGSYQGGSDRPTATWVEAAPGSIISANGGVNGNGGTVILWADRLMNFRGFVEAEGGSESGNGGFVEVSGKNQLIYDGSVSTRSPYGQQGILLLDPTNINISSGADSNVNGASPFAPTADDVVSNLNATTLINALSLSNVIVQTRATGAQAGDITVNSVLSWANGNTLTLDAHGTITINQAISGGGLTLIADNDVQLNANIAGTGALTIQTKSDSGTIGVGASATGTLNLSAAELARITDGWSNIIIGKTTGTGAVDIRINTWNDNLTLQSGTGIITINGAQTMNANNLTITTDSDLAINAALTGSGTLTIQQASATTTLAMGTGQTGTIQLDATELTSRLTNGWSNLIFGRTDGTGAVNVGALAWNDFLTLRSGTGAININGVQTVNTGNNMTIITDGDLGLNILNALTGNATGNLFIQQASAGTAIGFGDGQTGALNLTTAEVGRIKDGWASITLGRTDGTGDVNIGLLTITDPLSVQSGTGVISVNDVLNMVANALVIRTDGDINLAVLNALTGTGTLTVTQSSIDTTLALGDAQTGAVNLTATEIGRIKDGWTSLTFGRTDGTGVVNVGTLTWTDPMTLQSGSGIINVNGTQSMAANQLTIRTDADPNIVGNLTGTGTFLLTQSSVGTSMGLGTGQAGAVYMDSIELGKITNGWASLVFGRVDGTGDMNVGAATWNDVLTLRTSTGALNINGQQTMGANGLTLNTNSDLAINANLVGTGALVITSPTVSTSIGIGTGQAGTLSLTDVELARIINGFSGITIGSTTTTGAMNVGAWSWNDPLTLRTSTGLMTIAGTQNMAANALVITTDSNLALNANLTGTSTLTIAGSAVGTSIGVGTGQAGTLSLIDTELARISDGWTGIYLGSTTQTGAMNVGARTWLDPLILRTSTGLLTIAGAQTMGGNALTLTTGSSLAINAALTGTGVLSITGAANGTTIGVGTGQAGTVNLNDTELGLITDGWSTIVIGATAMTGALNVAGRTWLDSLDLRTNSGALNINGVTNMGGNNLTIRTNTDLALTNALNGTGTLNILTSNAATTMAIGTGQTGTLLLNNTELGQITNGWSQLIFGSTSMTGAMNIGAYSWNDNVFYKTAGGVISVNGAQTMSSNNLSFQTNSNIVIGAALTGTGILTIVPTTASTTMGIGNGQVGTLNLTDAEVAFITNGWSSIVLGNTSSTGAMNVGALTWNDNLSLISGTGLLTIAGTQTMGANNLTLQTNSALTINANLTGTGTLSILPASAATTYGIGTGQAGTLSLLDTELARIVNGWGNIILGRSDGTGAVSVGAYTWNDNLTLRSGSGLMTIGGVQTMGANNLTISTDSNLALNANLSGSGNLVIQGSSLATSIGLGTGQAGTLQFTDTEIAKILDGWTAVTIGQNNAVGNLNIGAYTWLNPTTFVSAGNVILNGAQNSTETSGTSLVFVTTNGAFINNAGASAINPGGGRYLVYSVAEANDTLGGLIRPTILTNKTYAGYGPASVVESGNVYLYSGLVSKILYLVIDDEVKEYGGNLPTLSYSYIGGLQNGDTLGDVIASYTITAVGSSALDDAGVTRVLTGSFTTNLGYTVNLTNGTLTVTKANLLVEADDLSREYGDVNPTLTMTYSGFRNGDDITDIDTVATASTTANALSNVGNYAINASGGIDNNYTFTYSSGNMSITKAALTATAQNNTRVYGDANPTLTVAYTGFKNGETAAVIDTAATASTTATALSNVNTYAITASGAIDDNYSFNYVAGTLSVTKASLVATADNKSRDYGDANPTYTVTYTGFKNGENASVIDTAATATSAATILSNVNTYAITASGAVDNNYSFTYAGGTLTINKATLTATADNKTRIYGDANPALTVTYTGFKNSENAGVIDTAATASTGATVLSDVGTYGITASGAVDNNYTFNYAGGTLTINKATLTATADDKVRIYGDANPALTVSYTGFKNGDTSGVLDTAATATTTATILSNVGTYGITASGASDNNYDFNYVGGTLTINKATLTATADNKTRTYGDANPALTISYTGFKNGDTSGVLDTAATAATTATILSNAGTYGITASGAVDNNYTFNYVDGTLTINKATLTATADDKARIYGDTNPALTVSYTGFKNGDTSGVLDTAATATTTATILSNVGTYGITASGASDNNYDFNYVGGTLTINKATLTAAADDKTRVYGDANPALTVTYTGFKNSENASVIDTAATAGTGATILSNVGTYGITASGAVDNNYAFNYVGGTLTINKATLTATADDKTRIYGDANPAFSLSYTGFKNGDTAGVIDTAATATTVATILSNSGTYGITASGASDNNYDFNYVGGTLTINKADLSVTADNKARTYGDANSTLTASYSGFKNGDTAAVLDSAPTLATAATNLTNVGSYAITLSGGSDNNYNLLLTDGTLTIGQATLTVTADNQTRTYGDANPALTVNYAGFKNGDGIGDLDTAASAATGATILSNTGTYAISASGASDANYTFLYTGGTLTITKADLTITADNKTRIYGDANPTLTLTYSGFKNGDTASVLNTAPTLATIVTALSDVGTYGITLSGGTDNNYNLLLNDGSLNITKAMLTVTANNQTRLYGDTNPVLTATYTGFKNSQNASVIDTLASVSTPATVLSNVGTYAITASGATDNNYDFSYLGGTLTVNKATLTATADNKTRIYGDANPALTVSYSGFKNGDTASVINSLATATTAATVLSNAGTYTITASGASDNNYNFIYNAGTLTVNKAILTISADAKTRLYGDANPGLSVSYSGFKNGDTELGLDTGPTVSTTATALSNVGVYTIALTGGTDNNYTYALNNSTLTINKALLSATGVDVVRAYGDANPALTVSYSGFKNGETQAVIDTLGTAATTATILSNVGTYFITVSGAADTNYDFQFATGNLTIEKADLTISADNLVRTYGDANPALTATYSGFKNGQSPGDLSLNPSLTTTATALSDAGTYAIVLSGGIDGNYNYILNNGTLTVNKASLTVNVDNKTRLYGDANPALTLNYSGFKNGDTSTALDTQATASTAASVFSNVGNYAITGAGGVDNNYTFAYVNGTLSITPASLTITINNSTREYGLANPAFTATYSGFKNGDTTAVLDVNPAFSTLATPGSNLGSYAITASGGADNNYSLNFISGNLTITAAPLAIVANSFIRLVTDPNPPLTYTAYGLRNGDTESIITGLNLSTTATAMSPEGSYVITASGASAANYAITYYQGVMQLFGSFPLPPPPTSTLPATVNGTVNNPGMTATSYTQSYNPTYNTIGNNHVFMTNYADPGSELNSGTGAIENGYIQIFYYPDPFATSIGDPLVFIDPNLYYEFDDDDTNTIN